MAYKGKEKLGKPGDEPGMTQLWTFDSRESLDRFAAILGDHDLAYEIRTKKAEIATGPDGVVIYVPETEFAKARRLLLRHRKRRTSADRH